MEALNMQPDGAGDADAVRYALSSARLRWEQSSRTPSVKLCARLLI